MTLLVTGACGFVMSNLVRHWLDADPAAHVVAVDAWQPDALWDRFMAPVRGRIRFVAGDVCDRAWWGALDPAGITHVVHGAAVTSGVGERERALARRTVEVNVLGTLYALEWARAHGRLARFVDVSTGSVYGDDGPDGPLPEDGWENRNPRSLYGISKRTGELIAMRYAAIFGLPVATVRLSSVYGPMDRASPARHIVCLPNRLVHWALAGRAPRLSTLDAVGDYIHAGDVAAAIATLLKAPHLEHHLFNIALGRPVLVREVLEHVTAAVPGFTWSVVPETQADIVEDSTRRRGAWGAYDIARLRAVGWEPRPLGEAIAEYVAWVRVYEAGTDWPGFAIRAPSTA